MKSSGLRFELAKDELSVGAVADLVEDDCLEGDFEVEKVLICQGLASACEPFVNGKSALKSPPVGMTKT
jgi:hypothetical protein